MIPAGPRFRRRVACLFLAAIPALSCGTAPDPAGSSPGSESASRPAQADPPPLTEAQARMVERLARISGTLQAGDDSFVGTSQIAELNGLIEKLPERDPQRWLYELALGRHHLRLGQVDQGILHHERAYRLLPVYGDLIRPPQRLDTVLELAVAWLRKGETENCALRHAAESCIFPIGERGVHELEEGSRGALTYLGEVLAQAPAGSPWRLKAQWLMNIAFMTLGRYPDDVPPEHLIPPEAFASAEPFPRFHDVAPRLGLNSFDLSGGVVVEDLDLDGRLDILVSTWNPGGPLRFYRNEGGGKFVDRAREAGLAGLTGGLNMIHADYDNDGLPDVLVLRGAWLGLAGAQPNSLLRNLGGGRFSDVTLEAGLGEVDYPTQTAGFADYDLDGDLDLYIGNEFSRRGMEAPAQLFRNEGDGTFVDVAAAAGVLNQRFAKGVAWGDYDGDRDPDLYVSNLGQENRLYRNEGDGTFIDVAGALGLTRPIQSFPTWFWDFDNDGRLDLFVAAYGSRDGVTDLADVVAGYLGLESRAERAALYRGEADGFRDVASEQGLTRVTLPMGSNHGDLDNDGFPDFYLGTGYPRYDGLMPNVMFRNRRGRGFADVTTAGGFGHLQKGHAVAFADLDDDGDQDVFEQMGGAFPGDAFAKVLYENPGFGNQWLKATLVGVRDNRSAIGARVRVEIVEDGVRRFVHDHVGTGGSFGSGPLRLEIGLGKAQRVEVLEVFWPAGGETQVFREVPAGQWIEIRQDRSDYRVLPLTPVVF